MSKSSTNLSREYLIQMASVVQSIDNWVMFNQYKPSFFVRMISKENKREELKEKVEGYIYHYLEKSIFVLIDENDAIIKLLNSKEEKMDFIKKIFESSLHIFYTTTINTTLFDDINSDIDKIFTAISQFSSDEYFDEAALIYMKKRSLI